MDSSLYIAFSAMEAEMHALDIAANNRANISTNGYREERSFLSALKAADGLYPQVGGTQPNLQSGPLVATGRDLDMAIEGEGFLVVQTDQGRRYTRDGGLDRSKEGILVNRSGLPVLGQGGPITLPSGRIDIDADGRLMVAGAQVGRLLLVNLPPESLRRDEGGYFQVDGVTEVPATSSRLQQGFLEKSNVDPTKGGVLETARHYQSMARAVQVVNSLHQQLIATAKK